MDNVVNFTANAEKRESLVDWIFVAVIPMFAKTMTLKKLKKRGMSKYESLRQKSAKAATVKGTTARKATVSVTKMVFSVILRFAAA